MSFVSAVRLGRRLCERPPAGMRLLPAGFFTEGLSVTYYATTPSDGLQRRQYRESAAGQEAAILDYFRRQVPDYAANPERIQANVLPSAPITSVRRAMTNLTQRGELVRQPRTIEGLYGRPVHLWALAKPPQFKQQELWA